MLVEAAPFPVMKIKRFFRFSGIMGFDSRQNLSYQPKSMNEGWWNGKYLTVGCPKGGDGDEINDFGLQAKLANFSRSVNNFA